MVAITATFDMKDIIALMQHPAIYAGSADDYTPPAGTYDLAAKLAGGSSVVYVMAKEGEAPVGFIMFGLPTYVLAEIHCGFLPHVRGKVAKSAIEQAMTTMFTAGWRKIVAQIPSGNRAAVRLAGLIGFKREGVNRASFLRGGILYDQILFGITRDEWALRHPVRLQ